MDWTEMNIALPPEDDAAHYVIKCVKRRVQILSGHTQPSAYFVAQWDGFEELADPLNPGQWWVPLHDVCTRRPLDEDEYLVTHWAPFKCGPV